MIVESVQHKKEVEKVLNELKRAGYRAINLRGKSPDGIAVKGDTVYAVEVMSLNHKTGKGWRASHNKKQKSEMYSMFDGLIYKTFKRMNSGIGLTSTIRDRRE